MCLPTFHQICPKSISVYTQFSQKSNCESILPRLSNGCKGYGLQDPLQALASHLLIEFLFFENAKKYYENEVAPKRSTEKKRSLLAPRRFAFSQLGSSEVAMNTTSWPALLYLNLYVGLL